MPRQISRTTYFIPPLAILSILARSLQKLRHLVRNSDYRKEGGSKFTSKGSGRIERDARSLETTNNMAQ